MHGARSRPGESLMVAGFLEEALDDFNLRRRRSSIIDSGIEDFRGRFAQFAAGDNGLGGGAVVPGAKDLADLFLTQD